MNKSRKILNHHRILDVRQLSSSTFVIKFEKKDINFKSGQHLSVGPTDKSHTREYSIYNAPSDNYIEILVKEVDDGLVSPLLKGLKKDDMLAVEHAMGHFSLNDKTKLDNKYLFIASGTGISPFHSMIKDCPELNYTILHGVRTEEEEYDREFYEKGRYISCTSRSDKGDYNGRITNYLNNIDIDKETEVYLCGNCDMIQDAYDILEAKGHDSAKLHAEVYF